MDVNDILLILEADNLVRLFIIIVACFIGSLVNDYVNTLTDEEETVKITRILSSTFTASMLMFGFSDYIYKLANEKMFIFLCFVAGATGFEIFTRLKHIDLVCIFWSFIDFARQDSEDNKDDKEE